ncbi:hypothetical protein M5K25_017994 [Dendrobium thyrsiflorum]|uniref:Uncharacterized protein n=1 Tax=Dendrobium thyrsiflorum TaxID=117978 RepID=A0ABD0UNW2_DENTH
MSARQDGGRKICMRQCAHVAREMEIWVDVFLATDELGVKSVILIYSNFDGTFAETPGEGVEAEAPLECLPTAGASSSFHFDFDELEATKPAAQSATTANSSSFFHRFSPLTRRLLCGLRRDNPTR